MKQKTIVGLIDSDGSFSARLSLKNDNQIGVTVNCTIVQSLKAREAIDEAARDLQTNVCETGGKAKIEIAFNNKKATDPKKKLLKILEKFKPLSPGKRRDYLIVKTINAIANTWAQKKHNKAPFKKLVDLNLDIVSSRKVGSAAIIFLRFSMTNEASSISQTKKLSTSKETYLNHLNLSNNEKALGLALGKSLFDEILHEENKLRAYLLSDKCRIPIPYIVGFYIGDGSLMVSPSLDAKANKLSITPYFTLIEGVQSKELLTGIQTTLSRLSDKTDPAAKGSIVLSTDKTTVKFKLSGWATCSKTIIKILSRYALPRVKQQSFNKFARICEMGLRNDHLSSPGGFKRMIDLIYDLHKNSLENKDKHEKNIVFQDESQDENRPIRKEQMLADGEKYFKDRNINHPNFDHNKLYDELLAKHKDKLKNVVPKLRFGNRDSVSAFGRTANGLFSEAKQNKI